MSDTFPSAWDSHDGRDDVVPSQPSASGVVAYRRKAVVTNPQGLHMRPAAAFAQKARQYESSVTVWHGERPVNGKNMLDLVLLAAEPGAVLFVEAAGPDAARAAAALAELISAGTEDCGEPSNVPRKG